MENDTHTERDRRDSVWSVRSVLRALTCSTVGALWPLVSERFNKVWRKKKKAKFGEKSGKEQQLKDNYLLKKGHSFHQMCLAVRKERRENELIPCSVNVKPLIWPSAFCGSAAAECQFNSEMLTMELQDVLMNWSNLYSCSHQRNVQNLSNDCNSDWALNCSHIKLSRSIFYHFYHSWGPTHCPQPWPNQSGSPHQTPHKFIEALCPLRISLSGFTFFFGVVITSDKLHQFKFSASHFLEPKQNLPWPETPKFNICLCEACR